MIGCCVPTPPRRRPRFSLLPEFHLLELIRPDTPTPRLDIFTIAHRYSLFLSEAFWISSRPPNFLLGIPDAVGIAPRYPLTLRYSLLTSSGSPNSILRIPDAIVILPSVLAIPSWHSVQMQYYLMPQIALNTPTIHLRQVIATSYNSIDPSLETFTSVTPYLAN